MHITDEQAINFGAYCGININQNTDSPPYGPAPGEPPEWLASLDGNSYLDPTFVEGRGLTPVAALEDLIRSIHAYDSKRKEVLSPYVNDLA